MQTEGASYHDLLEEVAVLERALKSSKETASLLLLPQLSKQHQALHNFIDRLFLSKFNETIAMEEKGESTEEERKETGLK